MSLNFYFVDLHIHVGKDWYGKPVKITGSKSLTVTNIVKEASRRKGLDMIGVIDAQSPAVQEELQFLLDDGQAEELDQGGIRFEDTVLLLGSEIEIFDAACQGPIHVLCYFPFLKDMRAFSEWLAGKMKNINLSSQRFYGTGRELQHYVKSHGGLFIPAHIFTPFKSLYGRGVHRTLKEVFDYDSIDAVELGLSADSQMADQIQELCDYPFVTNSDAHSLGKLAREYQQLSLATPSFLEWKMALRGEQGRGILRNYGLHPKMGKYHQTVCSDCLFPWESTDHRCKKCGSKKFVKGVSDRILELSTTKSQHVERPPYQYQVPLSDVPGIGMKTYENLVTSFGSEMEVIHSVPEDRLTTVVGDRVAKAILALREGNLEIHSGGGGVYGKVRLKSD